MLFGISDDGEIYDGRPIEADSWEKARPMMIEQAIDDYDLSPGDTFMAGEFTPLNGADLIDCDDVTEQISCRLHDEVGEASERFDGFRKEAREALTTRLRECVKKWAVDFKVDIEFFKVDEIEEITIPDACTGE